MSFEEDSTDKQESKEDMNQSPKDVDTSEEVSKDISYDITRIEPIVNGVGENDNIEMDTECVNSRMEKNTPEIICGEIDANDNSFNPNCEEHENEGYTDVDNNGHDVSQKRSHSEDYDSSNSKKVKLDCVENEEVENKINKDIENHNEDISLEGNVEKEIGAEGSVNEVVSISENIVKDNSDKTDTNKTNDLPAGWKRFRVDKNFGRRSGKEKYDYYIVTDQGNKLRSQVQVDRWRQEHNIERKVSLKGEAQSPEARVSTRWLEVISCGRERPIRTTPSKTAPVYTDPVSPDCLKAGKERLFKEENIPNELENDQILPPSPPKALQKDDASRNSLLKPGAPPSDPGSLPVINPARERPVRLNPGKPAPQYADHEGSEHSGDDSDASDKSADVKKKRVKQVKKTKSEEEIPSGRHTIKPGNEKWTTVNKTDNRKRTNTNNTRRKSVDSNKSEKETRGDLPCGWVRQVDIRETGHRVYCIVTNTGEILRSQRQLNQYLTDNSLGPVLLRGEASEISDTNDEAPNHDCDTEDVKVNNRVGTKKQKENVNPQTKNVPEVGGKEDDQEESNDEEELFKDELEYIRDVENFLKGTDLDLIPSPPTKGDGNCWYRAAADQASLHRLPVAPIDHQQMRLRVCDHLKSLPRQVKEDTINVVFVGKPRGLSDLAHRQRKPGQWVDNMGVMVLATAHFLGRNIHLIGYPPSGASCERGYSLTCIEGGEEGEAHPPLTIFYHDRHYQTLRPPSSTASQPQSNQ